MKSKKLLPQVGFSIKGSPCGHIPTHLLKLHSVLTKLAGCLVYSTSLSSFPVLYPTDPLSPFISFPRQVIRCCSVSVNVPLTSIHSLLELLNVLSTPQWDGRTVALAGVY